MKEYGKVSVILPLYNGENYIKETIRNILQSEYQNLELLIIDDGSTDNGLMYCEAFQRQDKRITIYSKENGGIVSARNYGVLKASGKYLCFCDQDDIVDNKCYLMQIERLEQDGSDLCMCSVGRSIDGKCSAFELSNNGYYENDEILEELLYPLLFNGFVPPLKMGANNRYPHIWSCMFRMDFWKANDIQFRAYVNFEDDLLVKTEVLAKAKRVSTIAHIGYYWRVNFGSETYAHKYIENLAEKQEQCFEDLRQSIEGRIHNKEVLRHFKCVVYCRQYLEAIHNLTSSDIKKTRKTILEYYNTFIYGRSFEMCIPAVQYVKKGKIKPQVLLKLLSKRHTMTSYYAELVLDWILLLTLHSTTLTKLERMLKGIKG